MKRAIITVVFGLGAFFALQYYKPSWAQETCQLNGTTIAWGWIFIAFAALLGVIISSSKK